MEWRRTKLIFIIAFLCLDLFLGWQVKQLLPPVSAAAVTAAPIGPVPESTTTAAKLPPLEVQTQNPTQVLGRLGIDPADCVNTPSAAPTVKGVALITCSGPGGAAFHDLNGLLEFTSPRHYVGIQQSELVAKLSAEQALLAVEPDRSRTMGLSGGQWNPVTHARVFYTLEKDAGGDILFNGGLQISVSASGLNILRWWLTVQPSSQPAQQTISYQQAVTSALQIIGPAAEPYELIPPYVLEGYYFTAAEQPGSSWTVVPSWQIRNGQGQCYYINAYNGQLESKGTGAAFLDPQPCFPVSAA